MKVPIIKTGTFFTKTLKILALVSLILLGIHLYIEPLFLPRALNTPAYHANFPRYIITSLSDQNSTINNTREYIQQIASKYINGVALDIKFTKDNVPIIYNAQRLEDQTNGRGIPKEYTWEQLKKYKYKNSHSNILSLEEVFKLVGSQKYMIVYINGNKIFNTNHAKRITNLINSYYLNDTVIVASYNPLFLMSMRQISHEILLMYNFTNGDKPRGKKELKRYTDIPWFYKQSFVQKQFRRIIRPDLLGLGSNFDDQTIKYFISHKYPIIYGNVDNIAKAERLFELGVKGVQITSLADLSTSKVFAPQIVYDAGGSQSKIHRVMHVKTLDNILSAIKYATTENKKITLAGSRHSMGGQTLLKDSIQINMLGINHVHYNEQNRRIIVGAGATWKKVQKILDRHGRSVKIMQSDNIFTIGGSISANVHGWQTNEPPIASTIVSMRVVTPDGRVLTVSREENLNLFRAIIGGYGQFGIIYDAEFKTVANTGVRFHAEFMERNQFQQAWQKYVNNDPLVELAYGRLSVDRNNLFKEIGLFYFKRVEDISQETINPEKLIGLKRAVFRTSQYFEMGKKIRWSAEKIYSKKLANADTISRNNAMNTDIHILWPLYGNSKDILHEYFIPKETLNNFLDVFMKKIQEYKMNILNVTIREIKKDNISMLPYAINDMFGLVCLFSQNKGVRNEIRMQKFTSAVIDEVIKLQGTFYLPYRLHYSKSQILDTYPGIVKWLETKKKWDPANILDSQFSQYITNILQ